MTSLITPQEPKEYPPFDISEFFYIKRKISECSQFYAALYNLAHCEYSDKISTACVQFDKEGNVLKMMINPTFWESLGEEAKTFVILHELSHIVYDHPKRFRHLDLDPELSNIASDIVINHNLCRSYGIIRELFDWEPYCWVETCFKEHSVIPPDNRSFEYYYNLLNELKNTPEIRLLGNHGEMSPTDKNEIEDSLNSASEASDEEIPEQDEFGNIKPSKSKKESKPEISETMKEIFEQNPELIEEFNGDPDANMLGFDEIKEHLRPIAKKAKEEKDGDSATFEMQEPPNFDKLMKLLLPSKKKKYREDENETWVGTHRRYMSFLDKNKDISLPNIYSSQKLLPPEKKNVWVFIDNSGSCSGMFHTFSTIAVSLMKSDQVVCRGFTFGDTCDEIKLSDNMRISFYSGNDGGFDCIEHKILAIMKKEPQTKYPDNIVVLSDGGAEFDNIKSLTNPKAWIMLINNSRHGHLTPPGGKALLCDSNFFKSKTSSKPKMR